MLLTKNINIHFEILLAVENVYFSDNCFFNKAVLVLGIFHTLSLRC